MLLHRLIPHPVSGPVEESRAPSWEGFRLSRWAQSALDMEETATADALHWPRDDTARQYIVLRGLLTRATVPATLAELARHVKGAPRGGKIGEMPRVLTALGQARDTGGGRFAA